MVARPKPRRVTAHHRLPGRSVTLRPLRPSDGVPLGRFLRDPAVTSMLPPRVRRESGREFVERVLRERRREGGVTFAILAGGSDQVVGQVRLFNWSSLERSAEVGCWVGRRFWGRGFGTEALRLVCRYAVEVLHLHRIDAVVVAGNERSERALARVGFRREGTSRRAARTAGGWKDARRYGLLRGELVLE